MILEFDEVTVNYPGSSEPALDRCTFSIERGERVALIGANGSGKTTILLAGVALLPHEGTIRVAGEELDQRSPEVARREIGFLFSNPEDQLLFPRVLDDIAFALTSRGIPEEVAYERARHLLVELGVADLAERSPTRLSRGQQLRVALAGILAPEPSLLLLDEPSSGLDPAGRRLLAGHLNALRSTFLIASHDLEFLQSCTDRYLLIEGGRIVQSGSDLGEVDL